MVSRLCLDAFVGSVPDCYKSREISFPKCPQIICSFRNFLLSNSFDVDEYEDEDMPGSQVHGQLVVEWIQTIKLTKRIVKSSQNRIEPDFGSLFKISKNLESSSTSLQGPPIFL